MDGYQATIAWVDRRWCTSVAGRIRERKFVDAVNLSNNFAAILMCLVALGAENWLRVVSEKAGPKVAAIFFGGGIMPSA